MHEKCGVAALVDLTGSRNITPLLIALTAEHRHRGQLGAGIAVHPHRSDMIRVLKNNGTIEEAIGPAGTDEGFAASSGIGHTRYATSGSRDASLAQPFHHQNGIPQNEFAFGFNGNLANYRELERRIREEGIMPEADVDTEVIRQSLIQSISNGTRSAMIVAIARLQEKIDGSCNMTLLNHEGDVYAYRDRHGFRPLAYARHDGMVAVASENSAIRRLWKNVKTKDVKPGELLHISQRERDVIVNQIAEPQLARCFFEWVYFAHYLSRIDNISVQETRMKFGEMLAQQDADIPDTILVVPVPDSARLAAQGYRNVKGTYVEAIHKRQRGRTFIEAVDREQKVQEKYTFDPQLIRDRDIVLIDDSLVRGTTMKILAQKLKAIGVRSIHLRLASPPILSPCPYGIDISSREELLAPKYHHELYLQNGELGPIALAGMAHELGVDSIRFVPVEGVAKAMEVHQQDLCMGCVKGVYPTPAGNQLYKLTLSES